MRDIRYITLLLAVLLCTIGAGAQVVQKSVTIYNNGNPISAEAMVDVGSHHIVLGNGQNACISHYTSGTVTIPGIINLNGEDYDVRIGQLAFRLCSSIEEVVIGEQVKSIGDFAFVGCSSLKKVVLPETMNSIGCGAFVNLASLTCMESRSREAPQWVNSDVFAYEGTAEATSRTASKRTLVVPNNCGKAYRKTKYTNDVGWEEAFGLISEKAFPTKVLEIATWEDLYKVAQRVNSGDHMGDYTIRLVADLEYVPASDVRNNWYLCTPIGTSEHPFMGVFDGGGHTIKNLRVDLGENVGIFGCIESASIGNVVVENASIYGTGNVGTLVGSAIFSNIHNVLVYEAKSASEEYPCAKSTGGCAGGIVGYAEDTNIDNTYFYGKVQGYEAAGGIAGKSCGEVSISDCVTGKSVEAVASPASYAGGIVGTTVKNLTIRRCYTRASISAPTKGGIVGVFTEQEDERKCNIGDCAWLNTSSDLPLANNTAEGSHVALFNRSCISIEKMEGDELKDLLGEKQWYYFHDEMNDCPIPASLVEAYMHEAGMKDGNGFIYKEKLINSSPSYVIVGYQGSATDIVIPMGYKNKAVFEIADRAFAGSSITSVNIPNLVRRVGSEAFADCRQLQSIEIGGGITAGKNTENPYNGWLDRCLQLDNISLSTDNKNFVIEDGVLYNADKTLLVRCSAQKEGEFTVPSTVEQIAAGAFAHCTKLRYVDLRENSLVWDFDRNDETSPFYEANPATLFVLNNGSTYDKNETNVVYWDQSQNAYYCDNLTLYDDLGLSTPVDFYAKETRYNRVFQSGITWVQPEDYSDPSFDFQPTSYTFCVPFQPNIVYDNGVKLYKYEGMVRDGSVTTVKFAEANKNANTGIYDTNHNYPYLMVVESGKPFTLSTKATTRVSKDGGVGSVTHSGYQFCGTYVTLPNEQLYDAARPAYILQSDRNWHKVPANQPLAYVKGFRCFFRAEGGNSNSLVTMIALDMATPTPTEKVVVRTTDSDGTDTYYDLNGRRLNQKPQQGMYIHNGIVYNADR